MVQEGQAVLGDQEGLKDLPCLPRQVGLTRQVLQGSRAPRALRQVLTRQWVPVVRPPLESLGCLQARAPPVPPAPPEVQGCHPCQEFQTGRTPPGVPGDPRDQQYPPHPWDLVSPAGRCLP